jgi:rhodanese-related sulfurtransferase/rubrerythrin
MRFLILASIVALVFTGCVSRPTPRADTPAVVTELGVSEITPEQARPAVEAAYSQFVDVRTPEEYAAGHAYRARNMPLETLMTNLDKLEKNEPVFLICLTGRRSLEAARMLNEAGFPQTISIAGGTDAWKAAGLPMADDPKPAGLNERTVNALISALEDERRAEATYQAVLNRYPDSRPFANVIEAEKRHQSFLLPLFEKYGVTVPVNAFDPASIATPVLISEACKAAVAAENENIALYAGFLEFITEQDIREVFTRLQSASRENHLPAFKRCAEGRMGQRSGRRQEAEDIR